MRALVLAGGKGTRLAPLTDTRPKPMVPFMGEPFAFGLLRRLHDAGCAHATFLVGADLKPFAALVQHGARLGVAVELSAEEQPLDTAGAARRALRGAHGPVLVCNGDILTDLDYAELLAAHRQASAAVTLALTRVADTSAYGVAEIEPAGRVLRFVEKPAPGESTADTVNAGSYVVDAEVFERFPGDGALSFEREVFPGLLDAGAHVHGSVASAHWADLGTPKRYLLGHRAVLEGRCRWPVPEGFSKSATAGAVHRSAVVGEGAVLEDCVLGAGAVVGAGAQVRGSVVFDDARIGPGADVRDAVCGQGASVGERAAVLPGAVLGDGARVADGARLARGRLVPPGGEVRALSQ